jgi:pyocin large subunit-like protein|tara:strand:+ start:3170 stop:3457 length:288 start_codon:yes stop_codon:yes gene_type:complete
MPYTEQELQSSDFYTSLKDRDKVKYMESYNKTISNNPSHDGTLRNDNDVILSYEDPDNVGSTLNSDDTIHVEIYQRRYRTNKDTKDILDRAFKEF